MYIEELTLLCIFFMRLRTLKLDLNVISYLLSLFYENRQILLPRVVKKTFHEETFQFCVSIS